MGPHAVLESAEKQAGKSDQRYLDEILKFELQKIFGHGPGYRIQTRLCINSLAPMFRQRQELLSGLQNWRGVMRPE